MTKRRTSRAPTRSACLAVYPAAKPRASETERTAMRIVGRLTRRRLVVRERRAIGIASGGHPRIAMTAPRGSFVLRLALVLLFACDAPAFAPPEEPGELRFGDGAPLGPEGEGVVAFDPVEAGSVATLALPIENRGRTPVSLTVDELSAPFFLARVPAGLPAEKGDAVVFGFQPETAGTFEAWTRIRSEGGDLRVRLYATGTKEGSCLLTIAPEELRFSIPSPAFDLPLRASVRLSNEGTRTCRVESLRVVGDEAFRLGARRFEDLPP